MKVSVKAKYIIVGLVAGIAVGGFFAYAGASFNEKINYQGKLTDSTGIAVPDSTYCMKFRLMDSAGGTTELWSEVWDVSAGKVSTTSGLFSVLLGSRSYLP